jgi:hypothetical protein
VFTGCELGNLDLCARGPETRLWQVDWALGLKTRDPLMCLGDEPKKSGLEETSLEWVRH